MNLTVPKLMYNNDNNVEKSIVTRRNQQYGLKSTKTPAFGLNFNFFPFIPLKIKISAK